MKFLLCKLSLIIISLSGCSALNDYNRDLEGYANVTDKTVGVRYKLWGADKPGAGRLSGSLFIEGKLKDGKILIPLEK